MRNENYNFTTFTPNTLEAHTGLPVTLLLPMNRGNGDAPRFEYHARITGTIGEGRTKDGEKHYLKNPRLNGRRIWNYFEIQHSQRLILHRKSGRKEGVFIDQSD